MPELYWEDFEPGQVIEIEGTTTLTKDEIMEFAREWDPQPFHIDEAAAEKSIYGGVIASGWHTGAATMRLLVDGLLGKTASLGSPGLDEMRWLKPVRPGDTLRARAVVHETRPSRSKPDRGTVKVTWETYNQDGEKVMTMTGIQMIARRPRAD
jgi:acyl dehydratase